MSAPRRPSGGRTAPITTNKKGPEGPFDAPTEGVEEYTCRLVTRILTRLQ